MTGNRTSEQSGRDAAATNFRIEGVQDIDAAWPDIERMMLCLIEYHRPWEQRALRSDWAPRMKAFLAPSDDSLCLLALRMGEVIGFLNGNVRSDFGIFDEASGFIGNAFVMDEARRSGVGSALVEAFERWCRQKGATQVTLGVLAQNQLGIGFWQKKGFEIQSHNMRKALEGGPP